MIQEIEGKNGLDVRACAALPQLFFLSFCWIHFFFWDREWLLIFFYCSDFFSAKYGDAKKMKKKTNELFT